MDNDESHGVFPGMGEAKGDFVDAQPLSPGFGAAVKEDAGRAAGGAANFDVLPGDATDAGAQGFHGGFLGGKSGGQIGSAAPAVGQLALSEDALLKPLPVTVKDTLNPGDFDDVDTGGQHGTSAVEMGE